MNQAFICDGVRTPIGRYGGALARARRRPRRPAAARAVGTPSAGRLGAAGRRDPRLRQPCRRRQPQPARMALLLAGVPVGVSGTTVNRLCGSGPDALAMAARSIKAGDAGLLLAGGAESMTRAPLVMGKADSAFSRRAAVRHHPRLALRQSADAGRVRHRFDAGDRRKRRGAVQHQPCRSGRLCAAQPAARRSGAGAGPPAQEIAPVSLTGKRRGDAVQPDEHPRPDTTFDQLQALKTPFRQPGSVTAGNASGLNDGAAALIVASEAMAARRLTPRARIVATATCGVEPRLMGIGPLPATRKVLEIAGLSPAQMDVIELNEAFAARALAVMRQLGLPDDAPQVNLTAARSPRASAGHERRAPGAGRPV